jgi:hypothetical protein
MSIPPLDPLRERAEASRAPGPGDLGIVMGGGVMGGPGRLAALGMLEARAV